MVTRRESSFNQEEYHEGETIDGCGSIFVIIGFLTIVVVTIIFTYTSKDTDKPLEKKVETLEEKSDSNETFKLKNRNLILENQKTIREIQRELDSIKAKLDSPNKYQ